MDGLNRYFDNLGSAVWRHLGLVGFVRENGTTLAQFGREFFWKQTAAYGLVGLLGSAITDMENALDSLGEMRPSVPINAAQEAVARGMGITGPLLTIEMMSAESIRRFYGGGYEIATLDGNKFTKIGDLSYLFWTAHFDGSSEIRISQAPHRVFRYEYFGDLLVIRSIAISTNEKRVSCKPSLYLVPPVYRELTASEKSNPPVPSFNSKWLCNYIWVTADTRPPAVLALVRYQGADLQWVKFDERPEGIGFWIEKEFVETIARQIADNPDLRKQPSTAS